MRCIQRHLFIGILLLLTLTGANPGFTAPKSQAVTEVVGVIRQDCASYAGPYPCYPSLSAWETDFGGIDFGAHAPGDLAAADRVAVARIEGTWTQPDTQPLSIDGWTTDAEHYVRIYTTTAARHTGLPGSGYRLQTTDSRPIYSTVAHLRIEGLEIHGLYDGTLVYLRPDTAEGVGEIHLSHNLIHGDGATSANGIYNYTCEGALKIWNNVIYDVGAPGYTAGIHNGAGTAYVYNNTIVDLIAGFAIRSNGHVVAQNNLTDAPGDDFYGAFYPASDFNASSDDTAPGWHARHEQTFTFVDRPNHDYHLSPADAGANNYGADLSTDPVLPITDDVDGQARAGAWDVGADQEPSAPDTVAPVLFNPLPQGTLPAHTTQATLSLESSESVTCRYAAAPDIAYADMPVTFTHTGALSHTHPVTGLVDEQTYTYYVKCRDLAGNVNAGDVPISFYVESSDAVPPVLSDVQAVDVSPYSARITWASDEGCTSQIEYGTGVGYGHFSPISGTRVLSHAVTLAGLEPETTYHFRVRSRDIGHNETVSGGYTFTTTALDNVYHVDQSHPQAGDDNAGTESEPWLTIQHAADVAQPGDTIIVHPGSYGRVAIRHGGTPGQYVTFRGLNVPNQSLVDPDALFDPQHPVQVPGNPDVNAVTRGFVLAPVSGGDPVGYVRVENFEVTAIYTPNEPFIGRGAIQLNHTRHVEVVRNFIHDPNAQPGNYNYHGIRGEGHDNLHAVIKDNTLYRVQGTGINVVGRDWRVEGNDVSHELDTNTDSGIEVGGDSDSIRFFGSGHVIRHNDLYDSLDEEQSGEPHIDCFQTFSNYPDTQFAYDVLIEGNYCANVGQIFNAGDPSESAGTGNKVHHLAFYNNVFVGARAFAMTGSGVDHLDFVNNVVADSGYGAINLLDCPYMTVLNNVFYNNDSGAQIASSSMPGSVWDYNVHYPDFGWPAKQPGYDQHSLFGVAPGFVDPAAGDFRLAADSPAVDRGIAVIGFNYDREGTARPQGNDWDVGAHEAVAALDLRGSPGDAAIRLTWTVTGALPATSTWRLAWENDTGDALAPAAEIPTHTVRSHTLSGLTNYSWYTVTLNGLLDATPFLTDTVRVMPTDRMIYLPLIQRAP